MTPEELLTQSLAKLQTANRIDGTKNSYRKDNPTEYAMVVDYLGSGVRPSGVTSDMGVGLMLAEDARRALMVEPEPEPPLPSPVVPVWSADHETGDLSQYAGGSGSGAQNSGTVLFHGASQDRAHTGSWSMKATIDTSSGTSAMRMFRNLESLGGGTYYYSAWFYLPQAVLTTNNHWNVFQFKSRLAGGSGSRAFWTVDFQGNPLRAVLGWKGADTTLTGPRSGDTFTQKDYTQSLVDVPIQQWTHIEAFLRQSGDFDGQITVWQDGVQLFDMDAVKTRYPDGQGFSSPTDQRFSVCHYSNGLTVNPYTLYIDDVKIADSRVGV